MRLLIQASVLEESVVKPQAGLDGETFLSPLDDLAEILLPCLSMLPKSFMDTFPWSICVISATSAGGPAIIPSSM